MFITVELIALGQRLLAPYLLEFQNVAYPFVDSCVVDALSWCQLFQVIQKQGLS